MPAADYSGLMGCFVERLLPAPLPPPPSLDGFNSDGAFERHVREMRERQQITYDNALAIAQATRGEVVGWGEYGIVIRCTDGRLRWAWPGDLRVVPPAADSGAAPGPAPLYAPGTLVYQRRLPYGDSVTLMRVVMTVELAGGERQVGVRTVGAQGGLYWLHEDKLLPAIECNGASAP